jgi:hypothetical protein
MAQESLDIPHSMRKVCRRFERRRSAHTACLPIPERLWAAVELAREHGVFPTRTLCIGVWQAAHAIPNVLPHCIATSRRDLVSNDTGTD